MTESYADQSLDRRYQVFVSSTFRDLSEQRKHAVEVILSRKHIPIALERFAASNESDLELIRSTIADCQIYLLIVGHRYGEVVPPDRLNREDIDGLSYGDISYTELEYSIARSHNLHTLVLQLAPEEVYDLRKELDPDNIRDHQELDNSHRLTRFYKRFEEHHRQFWSRKKDFKFEVLFALDDAIHKCERSGKYGWIREWEPGRIEKSNQFISEIVDQLNSFVALHARLTPGPVEEKKKALARIFREEYSERIIRNKVNLFFESGSTVAYVAQEISVPLSKGVFREDTGKVNIEITTNNVIAYFLLWLSAKIYCSPWPWSPPIERKFGAWYGGLEDLEALPPRYDLCPLDDIAKAEIQKLMNLPYRIQPPALLLGAASGLKVADQPVLVFADAVDQDTRQEFSPKVARCFGPHVGSYHNKLFKRFMYDTKLPIMIFLSSEKIDCPIEVGTSHFILDEELTWQQFCNERPVAFCIGCSQSERIQLQEKFSQMGFRIRHPHCPDDPTAFLARNIPFIEKFEGEILQMRPTSTGGG